MCNSCHPCRSIKLNHSLNFVDPTTGVHIQNVESYWNQVKGKFKRMKGVHESMLASYIDEFMWRERQCAHCSCQLLPRHQFEIFPVETTDSETTPFFFLQTAFLKAATFSRDITTLCSHFKGAQRNRISIYGQIMPLQTGRDHTMRFIYSCAVEKGRVGSHFHVQVSRECLRASGSHSVLKMAPAARSPDE